MGATEPWICLMYHELEAAGYFAVPASAFARHLDWIQAAGLEACSLEAAVAGQGRPRVAITFDDGTLSHFEHAVPALAARKMSATFFVVTDWVGKPGHVSWAQLREMRAAGMSIQSHTRSHPFLSECAPEAVREELAGSKAALDEALGQQTTTLGLPNGDWPRRAARYLIQAAGYRLVATSRWGGNRDAALPAGGPAAAGIPAPAVRRCTVRGEPDQREFARLLGRDPWLFARRRARETVLGALRSALGPTRYARWRRQIIGFAR